MARKFVRGKPTKTDMVDALGMALVKSLEERLLAPFVGNGTFVSGIAKGIISFIIPTVGGNNRWTKIASSAFLIDCAEDIVTAGLGMVGMGSSAQTGGVI